MNTKITAAQSTVDQCRAMGLKVGDTIEGRESAGKWWSDTRLTLIFLGEKIAVFREQSRNNLESEWIDRGESGSWGLGCRTWVMVEPGLTGDARQAHDQCRAAAHLSGILEKIYTAQAEILISGRGLVDYMGGCSAGALEVLGDLVNEMDANNEDDEWIDPIIEAAQVRWPADSDA